jgi:hypothetical protein
MRKTNGERLADSIYVKVSTQQRYFLEQTAKANDITLGGFTRLLIDAAMKAAEGD